MPRKLVFLLLSLFLIGPPIVLVASSLLSSDNGFKPVSPQTGSAFDIVWLVVAAVLVFMMQIGFLTFESASVRPTSAHGVAMKNFLNLMAAWLGFFMVGFGLMFGASIGGHGLFGTTRFLWTEMTDYERCLLFYQSGFCAVTATIISSALVERSQILANAAVSFFVGSLLFPLFGHWAWCPWSNAAGTAEMFTRSDSATLASIGWLNRLGFHDFAGSTVVHCVGGFAALAGVLVLGRRKSTPSVFDGDLPLATVGVLFLWIGWIGFNGGSVHGMHNLGHVIVNTNLSAIAAGISSVIYLVIRKRHAEWNRCLVGFMGGLVAITAGSLLLSWWEALFVGLIAGAFTVEIALAFADGASQSQEREWHSHIPKWGIFHLTISVIGATLVYRLIQFIPGAGDSSWAIIASPVGLLGAFWLSRLLWRLGFYDRRIDDPVDAIAIHGFAGALGTIMVGVLGHAPLLAQIGGVSVAILWSFALCYALFWLLNKAGALRATIVEEDKGIGFTSTTSETMPFWRDRKRMSKHEARLEKKFSEYQIQSLRYMTNVKHQVLSPLQQTCRYLKMVLAKLRTSIPGFDLSDEFAQLNRAQRSAERALYRASNMKFLEILEDESVRDRELNQNPSTVFDLRPIVQDIKLLLTDIAESRSIHIEYDPPPNDVPVRGHAEWIRQAVANVIENAVGYSDENEGVMITLENPVRFQPRGPKIVKLRVTSTGLAIRPDERTDIFQRNYRSKTAATKRPDGSGIGLYIVKGIMEIEKGDIQLIPNNTDAKISCFEFQLPGD